MRIFPLLAVFTLMLATGAMANISDDITAYYKLDETSGTIAEDATPSGYNGTASDAQVFTSNTGTSGKINSGADFTQGNDKIELPNAPQGNITVAFWFNKQDTTTTQQWIWNQGGTSEGLSGHRGLFVNNNIDITFFSREGTTFRSVTYNFGALNNTWIHVVGTQDGNGLKLYVNGVEEESLSNSGLRTNFNTAHRIGTLHGEDGIEQAYNGFIDEVSIWDRALSASEVGDLYDVQFSGLESGQYPTFSSDFSIFTSTYNNKQLLNLTAFVHPDDTDECISIPGINCFYPPPMTQYTTTSGFIVTGINDFRLVNFTITSNIQTAAINTSLTNYNSSQTYLLNYSLIEVAAYNAKTNAPIQTFTSTLGTLSGSTINGLTTYYTHPAANTLTITPDGYETTNVTVNNTLGYQLYNFSLNPSHSIDIRIFNATSLAPVTDTVTLTLTSGSFIQTNTTSTGNIFIKELSEGIYTVTADANGYQQNTYQVSVTDDSSQRLDIYLFDSPETSVIFTVRDFDTGNSLDNTTITIETFINGSYVVTGSILTDISGQIQLGYEPDRTYRFVATRNDYQQKIFILSPIIFDQYTIRLSKSFTQPPGGQLSGIQVTIAPSTYLNNAANNISLLFSSPTGSFTRYNYTACFLTTCTTASGFNAYGSTISSQITITDAQPTQLVLLTYSYELSDGTQYTLSNTYSISNTIDQSGAFNTLTGNPYGLPLFDRMIILMFITIPSAGIAMWFGGAAAAGLLAMLILSYAGAIGFITSWIIIPSVILLFIVVAWRSSA